MNKRLWISISILAGSIFLLALIIIVISPIYRQLGFGIILFEMSTISFLTGIITFNTATIQQKITVLHGQAPIPWWKQHSIITALGEECFAILFCLVAIPFVNQIVSKLYENNIAEILGLFLPFFLLSMGLTVYGITLTQKYAQDQRLTAQTIMEQLEKTKQEDY